MTDLYIVLGCGVLESKRRAKYAAEIVSKMPTIPLILTGGMPVTIPFLQHPKVTEARYMEKVFRKRGLENPIYLEEEAKTTAQNLLHSRRLIEETPDLSTVKEITIINGKAHLPRTRWLSRLLLRDYQVTEIPVSILGNGSSVPELLHGMGLETLSYLFEIGARRKNKSALLEWIADGKREEEFPGASMVYNRKN
ncbi:MAG: YdcF family protein [Nanoarchaeota archaeon]